MHEDSSDPSIELPKLIRLYESCLFETLVIPMIYVDNSLCGDRVIYSALMLGLYVVSPKSAKWIWASSFNNLVKKIFTYLLTFLMCIWLEGSMKYKNNVRCLYWPLDFMAKCDCIEWIISFFQTLLTPIFADCFCKLNLKWHLSFSL